MRRAHGEYKLPTLSTVDSGWLPFVGCFKLHYICRPGGLAQLARALAWHARGHRFDSDILHNKTKPLPLEGVLFFLPFFTKVGALWGF